MNEQIQELALQAANELADLFSPGFFDDRMVNDVAEINKRFAELIVRECANRATWAQDTGAADIGGEVLKHFGVAE